MYHNKDQKYAKDILRFWKPVPHYAYKRYAYEKYVKVSTY